MPLPRINPLCVFVTLCEYRVPSRALTLTLPPLKRPFVEIPIPTNKRGIMVATWGGDRRATIRRNQPDDVRLIPPYILRARA